MATLTLNSTPIEDDKVPAPSATPGLATTKAQEETIAAGIVPFVRKDDAAWDDTKSKFSALYKEVEKLTFDPSDIEGVGVGIEYRLTDYDILLAEALGLLEICLRARDDYHAKLVKAFDTLYVPVRGFHYQRCSPRARSERRWYDRNLHGSVGS
jgi:hypothetical protein